MPAKTRVWPLIIVSLAYLIMLAPISGLIHPDYIQAESIGTIRWNNLSGRVFCGNFVYKLGLIANNLCCCLDYCWLKGNFLWLVFVLLLLVLVLLGLLMFRG